MKLEPKRTARPEMTYPNPHLLLTVHWIPVGTTETAQFGLRFDSSTPSVPNGVAASQALVDSCASAVQTWWTSTSTAIPNNRSLQFLRLARIGTDGKYLPGEIAYDHVYAGGVPGGNSGSNAVQPLQISCAISLTTAFPRGRAHRGRIYTPTIGATYDTPGVWNASVTGPRATTTGTMLTTLNTVGMGVLSVFSSLGSGSKHVVSGVAIGNRPDIQRRRAKSIVETYTTAAVS